MSTYNLTLAGEADADVARAAFESIVNALRGETTDPSGSMTIDDVPYSSADVPEPEDFGETDAANDQSDDLSPDATVDLGATQP